MDNRPRVINRVFTPTAAARQATYVLATTAVARGGRERQMPCENKPSCCVLSLVNSNKPNGPRATWVRERPKPSPSLCGVQEDRLEPLIVQGTVSG